MIDKNQLYQECADMGISISEKTADCLDRYARMLVEWNEKMNLTAIVKPGEIVTKHFVDSLALFVKVNPPPGAKVIDVGTGAGFPGMVLKAFREDLRLTLLDSLKKRTVFLSALSEELGLDTSCIHARAEEAGRDPAFREQYDLATARAVAHLRELCEYCLPFVKPGGVFAALKAGEIEEECGQSQRAIQALGGEMESIWRFVLPDNSRRSLILIRKISRISPKYPRISAKIKKNPLI